MRKILVASAIMIAATLSACSAPANHGQAVEAPKASVAASEAPKATPTTPAKAEAPKATPKASEAPKAQTVKAEAPKAVQQAPKAVEQANAHMATAPKEFAEAHKPYIPCSAVGMVADAKGVCHAPTKAVKGHKATKTGPVQSVKAPTYNYVPAVDPYSDPTGTATNFNTPLCVQPTLSDGVGKAGLDASIQQLWSEAWFGAPYNASKTQLCKNDPASDPNWDKGSNANRFAAAPIPGTNLFVLMTTPGY